MGKNNFKNTDKYPYDTQITVKYHTIKPVSPPVSSKEAKKAIYQEILQKFEDAGFVNIRTKIKYDIIAGWFVEDGEVEKVLIDGKSKFSTDDEYRPDVEVIIEYHTLKKNKKD